MTTVTTRFDYDAVGSQTSVQDGLNHTTAVYDERDRPIRQTRPAGGGTTILAYDAHSRLISVTDSVGNV